jgi:hypothetical protein
MLNNLLKQKFGLEIIDKKGTFTKSNIDPYFWVL